MEVTVSCFGTRRRAGFTLDMFLKFDGLKTCKTIAAIGLSCRQSDFRSWLKSPISADGFFGDRAALKQVKKPGGS